MNERSNSNLITVLILFFELIIFSGLYYLVLLSITSNFTYLMFELLSVIIFLFALAVIGLTIGSLANQKDVWKIALGMMVVTSIAITFGFMVTAPDSKWQFILRTILYIFGSNTIIFLVTYYTVKRNLQKEDSELVLEIIEEPQSDYIS